MKNKLLIILISFFYLSGIHAKNKAADMVLYSFDRPLQLYALLESVEKYVSGIGDLHVIYRASNNSFSSGYTAVQKDFPSVNFLKQGDRPKQDFKPLTLQAVFDAPNDYIIFGVDDIIVTDYVDLKSCIQALEKVPKSYGFFLRCGKNITHHYMGECASTIYGLQKIPLLKHIQDDIYAWQFSHAEKNWAYPNTVDMTLYRKKDIEKKFRKLNYDSPNVLEYNWSCEYKQIENFFGLCFEQSKMVNIPLNRVQNRYNNNRHMNITTKQLLLKFNQGLKIDIDKFFRIKNKSPHAEYNLVFVSR